MMGWGRVESPFKPKVYRQEHDPIRARIISPFQKQPPSPSAATQLRMSACHGYWHNSSARAVNWQRTHTGFWLVNEKQITHGWSIDGSESRPKARLRVVSAVRSQNSTLGEINPVVRVVNAAAIVVKESPRSYSHMAHPANRQPVGRKREEDMDLLTQSFGCPANTPAKKTTFAVRWW